MSSQSHDERAASRAEARRRNRMIARGEMPDTAPEPEEETAPPTRGGLLRRIFPPAPPLPGRPDPLAGFDGSGGLRPVRERWFLLRSSPWAWIPTGIVAAIGSFASEVYAQGFLGLLGTFVQFGAVIAAGWIGWQRPTLFGTAASVVGFVLVTSLTFFALTSRGILPETIGTTAEWAWRLLSLLVYYLGLGFLGGWYGGYLRRRQTQLSAEVRRRR